MFAESYRPDRAGLNAGGKQGSEWFAGWIGRLCAQEGLGVAGPREVAKADVVCSLKFLFVQE